MKWLNASSASPNVIETVLREAQLVCELLGKTGVLRP